MNDCFLGSLVQRCPPDVLLGDHLTIINRGDPKSADFWLYYTGLQPREEDWATCWDILLRFLHDTTWFRRCWILQEFCLARDCLFICGSAVFRPNFELLAFLRSAILSIECFHDKSYNLATTLRVFDLRRETNLWINRSDSILAPQKIHLHVAQCLQWTRSGDVSLEADRVYSIIGIMKRLLYQAIPLVLPIPTSPTMTSSPGQLRGFLKTGRSFPCYLSLNLGSPPTVWGCRHGSRISRFGWNMGFR